MGPAYGKLSGTSLCLKPGEVFWAGRHDVGARISEFGAVVILAYHPKIAPILVYERYEGFGLKSAEPATLLLILIALVAFILLRLELLPKSK